MLLNLVMSFGVVALKMIIDCVGGGSTPPEC
jgi:hypothetical protein